MNKHKIKLIDIIIIVVVLIFAWVILSGSGVKILDRLRGNDSESLWSSDHSQQLSKDAPHTQFLEAIKELPVKAAITQRYHRQAFGKAWADENHNGCDTRNDILHRDLKDVETKPGTHHCVVLSGTILDPYTGRFIYFKRGPFSAKIQIDHVVALGNAWRSGAAQWNEKQRQEFANDPLNLLAVEGKANEDKSASSAAQWLPPNKGFRCAYVARQVAVKRKWHLWVSSQEKKAMLNVALSCPEQPLPVR